MSEIDKLRAELGAAYDRQARLSGRLHDANNAVRDLRAECADRESERADLRDRLTKAEAEIEAYRLVQGLDALARAEKAEAAVARVREVAIEQWPEIPGGALMAALDGEGGDDE